MINLQTIFNNQTIRFFDGRSEKYQPFEQFAFEDAISEALSLDHDLPAVRVWEAQNAVILGIADSRLPFFDAGVKWLVENGYHPVIRNSGGLAVMSDTGVLNLSLTLPQGKSISIHEGYQKMVELIKALLSPYTDKIEAFEVIGSYCPGEYDLSIDKKKFAGISQRRVKDGISIQIYLAVTNDNQRRAELIRDFYTISKRDQPTTFSYPEVNPDTMASLSELTGHALTTTDLVSRLETLLAKETNLVTGKLSEVEKDYFDKRKQHMISRNKRLYIF